MSNRFNFKGFGVQFSAEGPDAVKALKVPLYLIFASIGAVWVLLAALGSSHLPNLAGKWISVFLAYWQMAQ